MLTQLDKLQVKPLSANPTKWSNTLKQFVSNSQWIAWVFDHFVGLTLKGLKLQHKWVAANHDKKSFFPKMSHRFSTFTESQCIWSAFRRNKHFWAPYKARYKEFSFESSLWRKEYIKLSLVIFKLATNPLNSTSILIHSLQSNLPVNNLIY